MTGVNGEQLWVLDSVSEAVKGRGLTLEHSGKIVYDRSEWRAVVGAR